MSTLEVLDFTIYHDKKLYKIIASPYLFPARDGMPLCFQTEVNGKNIGDVCCDQNDEWSNDELEDEELLKRIGSFIYAKYRGEQKLLDFPTIEEVKNAS
jgi:hypothetical protein